MLLIIDVVAKGLLYYIKIYMSSSLIFMVSPILTEFNSVAYTSIMLEILTAQDNELSAKNIIGTIIYFIAVSGPL